MTRTKGTFGVVEQLPGGHYRARYIGPDGRRHKAPTTFLMLKDARGWLALQQCENPCTPMRYAMAGQPERRCPPTLSRSENPN